MPKRIASEKSFANTTVNIKKNLINSSYT